MSKIIVLGEAVIDLFAESGAKLRAAKSFQPAPGGAPANVAVALARLGADVGFIGKVGADDYGEFLIELLASEGVETTHFVTDPHGPTMLAVVATPSPTEQQFILYNGANELISIDDLPQAAIVAADIFIYGSITLAGKSGSAALQAATWAKDAGKHVIFDVNLRPALWPNLDQARQQIDRSVASATIIKLNEIELEFLTGETAPAVGSQQLIERGIQLCCVSLGEEGAYFNNGRTQGHVAAFPIDVQDTTGCGDAFVAGLAFQLEKLATPIGNLEYASLHDMIRFGNACGALTATQLGAMSASPQIDAVRALLA